MQMAKVISGCRPMHFWPVPFAFAFTFSYSPHGISSRFSPRIHVSFPTGYQQLRLLGGQYSALLAARFQTRPARAEFPFHDLHPPLSMAYE